MYIFMDHGRIPQSWQRIHPLQGVETAYNHIGKQKPKGMLPPASFSTKPIYSQFFIIYKEALHLGFYPYANKAVEKTKS